MPYFAISLLILGADQWLKKYMSDLIPLCEIGFCQSIEVLPIFKLMVLHNTGAAFSFLDDQGGWQRWFLVTVSSGVSLFIAGWLWQVRHRREQWMLALALSLVLGGALGNLVDRAVQGYVVDFLVFHYQDWYFPAFNIADAAISVGAALLILDMFVNQKKPEETKVAE